MRLPDFLIIGAMKAGTTSLYRDLIANPAVFFSDDKEPGNLNHDDVLEPGGLAAYARHFERARPGQICGEASTTYSQRPQYSNIPQRALKVLGAGTRIIYVVREPVARIISQHMHAWTIGLRREQIDEAVRRRPRFIDFSRYAWQITPWIETFGREQVMIVRFESYVENRRETVTEISRFLGVEPRADLVKVDVAYNRSADKPVPKGLFAPLRHNVLYRRVLRPVLGPAAREKLRNALLPRAKDLPDPPSPETVRFILDELREDAERLRVIMGRDEPVWDFDEVLERYGGSKTPAARD